MTGKQYELIKEQLGPCGLHCGKCFAFVGGEIQKYAIELRRALGNFDIYAERFSEILNEPIFEKYPTFKMFLAYLASAHCGGCRKEKCKLFTACRVRTCAESQGVDFCFQCRNFPCAETGFDAHLFQRHVAINLQMRKLGVENYYKTVKSASRYQ